MFFFGGGGGGGRWEKSMNGCVGDQVSKGNYTSKDALKGNVGIAL